VLPLAERCWCKPCWPAQPFCSPLLTLPGAAILRTGTPQPTNLPTACNTTALSCGGGFPRVLGEASKGWSPGREQQQGPDEGWRTAGLLHGLHAEEANSAELGTLQRGWLRGKKGVTDLSLSPGAI